MLMNSHIIEYQHILIVALLLDKSSLNHYFNFSIPIYN